MTEFLILALALTPLRGIWATRKLYVWYQYYGTRLLWGLYLASTSAVIASLPISVLSIRRLIMGPDFVPWPGTPAVSAICIMVLEGAFVFLAFRWRDLDEGMNEDEEFEKEEKWPSH